MPVFSQAHFDSFFVEIDGSVMAGCHHADTHEQIQIRSEDKHSAKIPQSEIPALDKHVQDIV